MSLDRFAKLLPTSYHWLSSNTFCLFNQPAICAALFKETLSKTPVQSHMLLARQFREGLLRAGIFGGMSKAINVLQLSIHGLTDQSRL